MKITEKRLRNIINSVLNEFDMSNANYKPQYDDKGFPNKLSIADSLDSVEEPFHKERRSIFKRRFSVSPNSAIQYFKDILSQDHSEFMNFMHVFLDFMLNINDALKDDRENFKTNYEQMLPVFVQYLKQYHNQGHNINQDLVNELGQFFVFLGRKLSQVNLTDLSHHEDEEKSMEQRSMMPERWLR